MRAQNLRHRRWHQAEASRDGKRKEEALGTARETPSRRAAGAGAIAPTRRGTGTRPAPATRNLRSPLVQAQRKGKEIKAQKHRRSTVKTKLLAHKILFPLFFAPLPSTEGVTGLAWSQSQQAWSRGRNSTTGISSGPELAFARLGRCPAESGCGSVRPASRPHVGKPRSGGTGAQHLPLI